MKMRELWTDNYLVYESEKSTISLAIMHDCTDKSAAIKSYNREHKKGPRATFAVRISTFAGTLHHLISLKDPGTLRWIAEENSENTRLGREIAAELGVELPKPRKRS
jgi:hypothetical protein